MNYKYIDENKEHLHTLGGKPLIGTSTACKIIGKGDGLITWAANCAVDHVKDKAEVWDGDSGTSYEISAYELEQARTAHIKKRGKSAEKGTERHGLLEQYVRSCLKVDGKPHVLTPFGEEEFKEILPFTKWAEENVERFLFTEANCCSEKLWLGGIADIGLQLKDGRRLVGDHKSSKSAYFGQFIQAALYDIQLSENGGLDKDGNKLFDWQPADGIVIFPFRSSPFTPEFRWGMDEYRKAAEEVVHIYKLSEAMKG